MKMKVKYIRFFDEGEFAVYIKKLAPSESVENWWEVDEIPPQPEDSKIDYIANEYINTEPEE